jgi:hypothetical protein
MNTEQLKKTLDKLTNKLVQPNHDELVEAIIIGDIIKLERRIESFNFYDININVILKLDKSKSFNYSKFFYDMLDICEDISNVISYAITTDFKINVEFFDKNYILINPSTFFKNKTGQVYTS